MHTATAPPPPSCSPTADALDPFQRLPEPLQVALRTRGYGELTAVQRAVLEAGEPRDLWISSETGSGKTVAVGMRMAGALMADEGGGAGPVALIVTPTRELAVQVRAELAWLYAGLRGTRVAAVTGGTSVAQERQQLARRPRVLVGTPGRLLDHLRNGALDCAGVRELVLDEADQMLDMGFREELEALLAAMPAERHTHMVSATFPPAIARLAQTYQRDPLHVEGTRLGVVNADIEHIAHKIGNDDRYAAVVNLLLLAERERTLIFVRTRAETTQLAEQLAADGFSAAALSGELQQAQRTRTLAAFRAGTVTALVATDVAARGLDIPDVASVIQAGIPTDGDMYVHRSGRTGRAGRKGRCVLLVPVQSERRVRQILAQARVETRWCDVPAAELVERELAARARARLLASVDGRATTEAELERARELLAGRDPARVVVALIEALERQRPREPMKIEPVAERTRGWKHRERAESPGRPPSGRGPRERREQVVCVRFTINWGVRGGADARRVLAMLCRKGGFTSRAIGAIDLGADHCTVEVARDFADQLERRARHTDSRDPWMRIQRAGA